MAMVWVDGRPHGEVWRLAIDPLVLPSGRHTIELRHSQCEPYTKVYDLKPNKTLNLSWVCQPRPAELMVRSDVNARIERGDNRDYLGQTNKTIAIALEEFHTRGEPLELTLIGPAHKVRTATVTLHAGRITTHQVSFAD